MTDFLIKEENYRGYMHVETPPLGKKSLYETTGHYDKHSIDMYPSFDVDGTDYVMKLSKLLYRFYSRNLATRR